MGGRGRPNAAIPIHLLLRAAWIGPALPAIASKLAPAGTV